MPHASRPFRLGTSDGFTCQGHGLDRMSTRGPGGEVPPWTRVIKECFLEEEEKLEPGELSWFACNSFYAGISRVFMICAPFNSQTCYCLEDKLHDYPAP